MKLVEHHVEVAVEVAHQYYGSLFLYLQQDLACLGGGVRYLLIEVVEDGRLMAGTVEVVGVQETFVLKVFKLYAELDGQCLAEGVVGLYYRNAAQGAFSVDIRLTELLLVYWDVMPLVRMPQHLAPVASVGVYSSTVIEDISFCIHVSLLLYFSVYFPAQLLVLMVHVYVKAFKCRYL